MKTKFLFPLIVAGMFVACSDDSSSNSPVTPEDPGSSAVIDPGSSATDFIDPNSSATVPVDPTSSETVPMSSAIDPLSSSDVPTSAPSGGIDPVPPAVDGHCALRRSRLRQQHHSDADRESE